MATYKVIQDIEAEDKLLGPLTLRQFIFAIIAIICFYFSWLVTSKGVAFLSVIFLPPGLFAGFFAFPWGRDQPTEVWALAKIRFLLKPRKRIWDQSGIKELVTITAQKREERVYSDGLSQTEVRSRLTALANTIDSRGWAIKNVNINMYGQAPQSSATASDRLVDISSVPQEVSNIDVTASDDILDVQNNPIAQQFDRMINASAKSYRDKLIQQMNQTTPPPASSTPPQTADYWFLNQPIDTPKPSGNNTVFASSQIVAPGSELPAAEAPNDLTIDEKALTEQLKMNHNAPQASYSHLRTIQPLGSQPPETPRPAPNNPTTAAPTAAPAVPPPVTRQPNPAILELANNDDLNVATIARQANKSDGTSQGEVVISLH